MIKKSWGHEAFIQNGRYLVSGYRKRFLLITIRRVGGPWGDGYAFLTFVVEDFLFSVLTTRTHGSFSLGKAAATGATGSVSSNVWPTEGTAVLALPPKRLSA